jgi:hypothetical protein
MIPDAMKIYLSLPTAKKAMRIYSGTDFRSISPKAKRVERLEEVFEQMEKTAKRRSAKQSRDSPCSSEGVVPSSRKSEVIGCC